MKLCCICGRPIDSYYRTASNKVYCFQCWRDERMRVLGYMDMSRQKYLQECQQYERLKERWSELKEIINTEERKREEIQDIYTIKQCRQEILHVNKEISRIGGNYGPKPHPVDRDILTAKFFVSESAEANYLLEKAKADEIARQEAEKARIKAEKDRKRLEQFHAMEAARKAEREKKEKEEKERIRKIREQESIKRKAEQERKERIRTTILWIAGIVVVAAIVVLGVIFWEEILNVLKWVLGGLFIMFILSSVLSN